MLFKLMYIRMKYLKVLCLIILYMKKRNLFYFFLKFDLLKFD